MTVSVFNLKESFLDRFIRLCEFRDFFLFLFPVCDGFILKFYPICSEFISHCRDGVHENIWCYFLDIIDLHWIVWRLYLIVNL